MLVNIWREWQKVVWPSRSTAAHNTVVVASAVVLLVAFVSVSELLAGAVNSALFG